MPASGTTAAKAAIVDTYPNCFHGSTSANLHFHGTHTSPSGTGDNVFLNIRPSPRDKAGNPTVTAESVAADFKTFFDECGKKLNQNNLLQWPATWDQLPRQYVASQLALLWMDGLGKAPAQQLWRGDMQAALAGQFPQYYIGAFPSCFLLPDYAKAQVPPGSVLHMGQAPGTHWYHAHKHGATALNVSNGMAGAFIVEDNRPDGYDGYLNTIYGPGWTRTQPTLVVNQMGTTPGLERRGAGSGPGGFTPPFSVNGQQNPNMTMYPGQVMLWRVVNASPNSGFYISANSLPAGYVWRQTAQDGVQFDDFNYNSRAGHAVFVAPGNRIDLLVQAPANAVSGPVPFNVIQNNSVSNAEKAAANTAAPLFTIQISGSGPAMPPIPASVKPRPSFLSDIPATIQGSNPSKPLPTKQIVFRSALGGGIRQHYINDRKFDEGFSVDVPMLNTTEEWTIVNASYNTTGTKPNAILVDHPFHIHINPFQITEVFDPNALLQNYNGQPTALPLYVVSTTKPTLQMGQCWVNPNDKKTWKACATFDPKAPLRNNVGQPIGTNLQPASPTNPAAPQYVQQTAKPATMLPGQCWIDPNNQSTWKPCPQAGATNIWWDVFPIPAPYKWPTASASNPIIPGYFKMRSRFVDYPGSYVIHCHILAHEDRGMMAQVNVGVPPGALNTHHH